MKKRISGEAYDIKSKQYIDRNQKSNQGHIMPWSPHRVTVLSSKPTTCHSCGRTTGQTDRRMDARSFRRPCYAYYASSVNDAVFIISPMINTGSKSSWFLPSSKSDFPLLLLQYCARCWYIKQHADPRPIRDYTAQQSQPINSRRRYRRPIKIQNMQ